MLRYQVHIGIRYSGDYPVFHHDHFSGAGLTSEKIQVTDVHENRGLVPLKLFWHRLQRAQGETGVLIDGYGPLKEDITLFTRIIKTVGDLGLVSCREADGGATNLTGLNGLGT